MYKVLSELKRYAFIYMLFAKNCFISQMEYRLNFAFGCMIECAFLIVKILYVVVVYNIGEKINGITPDEVLLFVGAYTAMTGIYVMLFWKNFTSLPEHIRTGTLDMYMVKPVSLQFITTMRYVDIGLPVPNLIGGIVMIVMGWKRVGIEVNVLNVAGFIVYMIMGVFMTYAIFLLPQLLAFWVVKTGGLIEITSSLWDFNNMPMFIYNKWIQKIGIYVLPLFLITNFPPLFVLHKMSTPLMLWGIAAPVIFMFITRVIWNIAIRNYTSASS